MLEAELDSCTALLEAQTGFRFDFSPEECEHFSWVVKASLAAGLQDKSFAFYQAAQKNPKVLGTVRSHLSSDERLELDGRLSQSANKLPPFVTKLLGKLGL